MVSKEFVTAGKAIFTVHNPTGTHFTFRVKKQPSLFNRNETTYVIGLLVGPDNTKDYAYVGMLNVDGSIRLTKNSTFNADDLAVKVFNWAMKVVWQGKLDKLPNGYGIKNEGRCGRCGRVLTTPESIDSGLGPECVKKAQKTTTN